MAGTAFGQGNDTLFSIENVLAPASTTRSRATASTIASKARMAMTPSSHHLEATSSAATPALTLISFAQLGLAAVVNLSTSSYTAGTATGTLNSVENVTGSDLNDTITGTTANNIIDGGKGSDILNGGAASTR
jgi:Ca2+-binding RTX toxin-like protein